jgi:hypothetical protein
MLSIAPGAGIAAFASPAAISSPANLGAAVVAPSIALAGNTSVDLSTAFNLEGITADGATFSGGLDGVGYAYSGSNVGPSLGWNNASFNIGPLGSANVIHAAGQSITLPSGQDSQLDFLATGVEGNQPNQTFVVNYSDGTSASLTQNISDWFTPQNYAGESIAAATNYRNTASGSMDSRTFNVYGYSINLDSTKTVSSIVLPNNGNVEVLAVTLLAPVDAPTGLTATAVSASEIDLSFTDSAGDASGYNVYRSTQSGAESATPINTAPLPPNATTYQDTTALAGNSYFYVVKAVNGPVVSASSNEATAATVATSGNTTQVDLGSAYNLLGIVADGDTFSAGLDGLGNALSGTQLGSTVTSNTVSFAIGPLGSNNVIQSLGQNVALPASQFSQLDFLATGVNGNQPNQVFKVNYTDGTSTTVSQSLSDWYTPQNYAGETVAAMSPYRDKANGGMDNRRFDIYSYAISLDSTKTVSSITLPNNSHVDVLAISTVAPIAAPTGLTASAVSSSEVDLSFTAPTATSTGFNIYRGTSAGAESTTPLNGTPLPANTTTYQDTSVLPGNTYFYTVKTVNLPATSPASNEASATVASSAGSTQVDLASAYNLLGITQDGAPFSGGLDGLGFALSGAALGSTVTAGGASYQIGPVGSANVVQASGQTISLPASHFSTLSFLATGVDGNQPGQSFTVNYSDGTSTHFTQGISDWFTPQGYSGETVAVHTAHRNTASGGADHRTFDVYSYSLTLDNSKTVSSITLPNNHHVTVLAIDAQS